MFPSKGSGPRSTLLEMLDSISVQEQETMEVLPPPLPVRPSSRARLPSSVIKARKHLVLDHVTLPTSKCSTLNSTPEKNNHMCDSPIANLVSSANSEMCTPRPCSSQLALDSCSGDDSAIGNVQTVSRVVMDEGSSDLVTSPSFIPGACKLAEAREGEGGAAVSDCRDIGYDSQQPVVISVQEVEVGQPNFSFLTSESTSPPHTPVQQDPVAAVPMTPPTTARKWKDDGTLRLKKNLRVWCLTLGNIWIAGVVISAEDTEAVVRTSDHQVIRINSAKLQPVNPDILEGVDDLIKLSYLNEPSVLHNLDYRYDQDMIYTRAGPVLIAVNPFKKVPIYGPDNIQAYQKRTPDSSQPHVYMTADSAFRAMMRGTNMSQVWSYMSSSSWGSPLQCLEALFHEDKLFTMLCSGESGAGKTETAKITMQYLAALGGGGGLEDEILQTNPILEAFGNAKTLRNDNSSRFGKLIDIHFDKIGKICGAKIQTYLLEKSRVVQQAEGERSYHVFYQLCAGADAFLRERVKLRSAKEYRYLNQSSCMAIDKVDDAQQFQCLRNAMNVVQISKEDQAQAFEMLSAVLWIGNITFRNAENDNHVVVDENEALEVAAALLHCNVEKLVAALSTRKIRAGGDNIVQRLTISQATDSRDALAKAIYASLFDWLVECVNKSLEVGKKRTGRSISILDIYGFESFKRNSFEQLCINYANERLQQHFNRHLFKLEQEEYSAENIDWTRVDFEDNQECLDLIEKRPLGMISLLDEECTFPRATDLTLANKLKDHLKGNMCFKGEWDKTFRIFHYAGEVLYETHGFLEKNRDFLHSDLLQLLASCDCVLAQLFAASIGDGVQKMQSPTRRVNSAESQKQSVATKFKGQLYKLMQRLEETEPHFIRCIKPNTQQLANVFDQELVLQQLRCCGVLEVVRISRSGYPTRHSHHEFASRYGFLLPRSLSSQEDMLSICVAILHQFGIAPEMYQVGITKLFFRAGQIGVLEDVRLRTLQGVTCLQALYRGYKVRCQYKKRRKTTIFLQCLVRGAVARKRFQQILERHRAAVFIQKHVRRLAACRLYQSLKAKVVKVQSVVRMWLAKRELQTLKREAEEKAAAESREQEAVAGNEVGDEPECVKEVTVTAVSEVLITTPEALPTEVLKEATIKVQPSYLLELQRRAVMAEKALREKEEDNALLRQRLQHYEARWMEYEAKMSSMEEVWQKQMSSLQLSLAAAKKSLATDESILPTPTKEEPVDLRATLSKHNYAVRRLVPPDEEEFDFDEDASHFTKSPERVMNKYLQTCPEYTSSRGDLDTGRAVVSQLVAEYDHRKQVFTDDVDFLVEVKSGVTEANLNPEEELRKLKVRFDAWKKDFKLRLRDTKVVLHKLCNGDSLEKERTRKKWWGKRTTP